MSSDLLRLWAQLVDGCTVVAPRGWQGIELELATAPTRVNTLSAEPDGEPHAKRLGLDEAEYFAIINGALGELAEMGIELGPRLQLTRTPDAVTVSSGEKECIALDPSITQKLVFTDTLLDTLYAARPSLRDRHAQGVEVLRGHDGWQYSLEERALKLTRGDLPWRTLRAEPIGMLDREAGTFNWSSIDRTLPEQAVAKVTETKRRLGEQPGLSAFAYDWLPCDEGLAISLSAFLAKEAGSTGHYAASLENQALFFAWWV